MSVTGTLSGVRTSPDSKIKTCTYLTTPEGVFALEVTERQYTVIANVEPIQLEIKDAKTKSAVASLGQSVAVEGISHPDPTPVGGACPPVRRSDGLPEGDCPSSRPLDRPPPAVDRPRCVSSERAEQLFQVEGSTTDLRGPSALRFGVTTTGTGTGASGSAIRGRAAQVASQDLDRAYGVAFEEAPYRSGDGELAGHDAQIDGECQG